ncbi:MAG TPA: 5'-nucleotidase, lipoprotein e(P4) family [Bacteroidales bacterium]|nr:5'-nucleotidase, lipoprotein e(P4) family [Bacteroidales bacterium]
MKKILVLLITFIIIINSSCSDKNKVVNNNNPSKISNDYLIMSVLFHQQAAEYKALCYQAFNIARIMIDKDIADKNIKATKRAIILDIDETILDNSPYEAKCILDTIGYPKMWDEWCKLAVAEPLPGAVDFLNYVASKGIEIFYISNRKEKLLNATIKNLKDKGFPMADEKHLLFRKDDEKNNSKEKRRNIVEQNYHIILYLGDNLADFSKLYDDVDLSSRNKITDSLYAKFGHNYIILPNSMYGDWEMVLYNKNIDTTALLKYNKRRSLLKSF